MVVIVTKKNNGNYETEWKLFLLMHIKYFDILLQILNALFIA